MTRDRGPPWPYPQQTSLPPSTPAQHAPHSGNGVMAEVRERVRALEATLPLLERMAVDRLTSQAGRMDGVDRRLAEGDTRMAKLDERLTTTERATASLPALETRVGHIERRWASWKAGLQYGVAALIFALVLAGKMTWGQAMMLLKLLLPLSPG
jgi:hypothetical protein